MKSYNNNMFLGPGTIQFANGTEIPFTRCEGLEMEFSYDLASSMSAEFRGTRIIPPREEKEEMTSKSAQKFQCITVKFPNNNRTYDYKIASDGTSNLFIEDDVYILNDCFYAYSKSIVKIIGISDSIPDTATRQIIAWYDPEAEYAWVDRQFLKTTKMSGMALIDKLIQIMPEDEAKYEIVRATEKFDNSCSTNNSGGTLNTYKTGLDGDWTDMPIVNEWGSPIVFGNIDNSQRLGSLTTSSFSDSLTSAADSIKSVTMKVEELSNIVKNQFGINKGEDKMNIFGNFDFGKVKRDNFAMSLKGIAFYSIDRTGEDAKGTYVQYNVETNELEDVTPFLFHDIKAKDFLYKMPVATSQVKVGDIIFDNSNPVFVKKVNGSEITIVDPNTREIRTILAAKNAFNFNFVTKIVNLMDNFNLMDSASAENPFGNILPLMMLSDNKNMKDMLPLMLLGNSGGVDFASNPMMLYFLMKDGESNDILPFLLMSNNGLFSAPAKDVE